MYKNLILLTALMVVFVSSCKKDDTKRCKTGATLLHIKDIGADTSESEFQSFYADDCGVLKSFRWHNSSYTIDILSRNALGNIVRGEDKFDGLASRSFELIYDSRQRVVSKEIYGGSARIGRVTYQYDQLSRLALVEYSKVVATPAGNTDEVYISITNTYNGSSTSPEEITQVTSGQKTVQAYTYDGHLSPVIALEPQAYYLGIMETYGSENIKSITDKYGTGSRKYNYRSDGMPVGSDAYDGDVLVPAAGIRYVYNK